jgi:hypothetical protein
MYINLPLEYNRNEGLTGGLIDEADCKNLPRAEVTCNVSNPLLDSNPSTTKYLGRVGGKPGLKQPLGLGFKQQCPIQQDEMVFGYVVSDTYITKDMQDNFDKVKECLKIIIKETVHLNRLIFQNPLCMSLVARHSTMDIDNMYYLLKDNLEMVTILAKTEEDMKLFISELITGDTTMRTRFVSSLNKIFGFIIIIYKIVFSETYLKLKNDVVADKDEQFKQKFAIYQQQLDNAMLEFEKIAQAIQIIKDLAIVNQLIGSQSIQSEEFTRKRNTVYNDIIKEFE